MSTIVRALGYGLVAATGVMLVTACSSAPDCASTSALKLVDQLIEERNWPPPDWQAMMSTPFAQAKIAAAKPRHDDYSFWRKLGREMYAASARSFDTVRTTEKDSSTGAVQCVARLHMSLANNEGIFTSEVTYRIEKTADGKEYVTFLGRF